MKGFTVIYSHSTKCIPSEELPGLNTPGFFFFAIESIIDEYRQKSENLNFTLAVVIRGLIENFNILIVDDDPLNFKLMKTLLQFTNFDVDWFKDANNLIETVSLKNPDLILMDIQLPGTDGHEATRNLKESEKYKDIPVIAVSAHAMEKNKREALASGNTGYITKPPDTRIFANSISGYL